jgi:hypothetical protein
VVSPLLPLVSVINPVFFFGWAPGLLAAYAICFCAVSIKKGRLTVDPLTLFFAALASAYVLLSALYSPFIDVSQAVHQATIMGILPIVFILVTHKIPEKYKKLGLLLVALLGFSQLAVFGVGDRGHFGGIYNSGSIFGGQVSLLALISAILFIKSRMTIYLFLFVGFLTLLVLANHRTGIVALLICGFYAVLSMRSYRTRRLIIGVVSFLLLLPALPYLANLLFFDSVISLESLNTSGRLAVWPTLLNEWFSGWVSVVFGGGAGLSQHILISQFDGINAGIVLPHNEFIRLGVDYGFLGLLLCFGVIIRAITNYTEFANILCLHFIIECLLSNVFFWQISYFLPMFIFLRKNTRPTGA